MGAALKWFWLAAEQGLAQAQGNLGLMYELGWGVAQDYVYAHMWLNLAAASLHSDESTRDLISKRMTSEQISQAQAVARKCQESGFKNCD